MGTPTTRSELQTGTALGARERREKPANIRDAVVQNCPFPIVEKPQVILNTRKVGSALVGHIKSETDFIKFSDDPKFSKELQRHRTIESFFVTNRLKGVRVPRLFEIQNATVNGRAVKYARFEFISDTRIGADSTKVIKSLLRTIRQFKKIPVHEFRDRGFERKTKHDYLKDVITMIDDISVLAQQMPGTAGERVQKQLSGFEALRPTILSFFAEQNGFSYDLAQSFTHSDFSLHNVRYKKETDEVYLVDFEKVIEGSLWEDYARMFYDLHNDVIVKRSNFAAKLLYKFTGRMYRSEQSAGTVFWNMLSEHEKKHTMLFVVYKALYLLRHHLRKLEEDNLSQLRIHRVLRCYETLVRATQYCSSVRFNY